MPDSNSALLNSIADQIVAAYAAAGPGGIRPGVTPPPFPDGINDLTVAEAYAVQDLAMDRLSATCGALRGYKIGGVDRFYGRLLDVHFLPAPAVITLAESNLPLLEAEVLVRSTADLAANVPVDQIAASVEVGCGFEIPAGRFADWHPHTTTTGSRAAFIADNALAAYVIPGTVWRSDLAPSTTISVTLTGAGPTIRGERTLTDVYSAVSWFLNELGGNGKTLPAGSVIATGTLVMPAPTIVTGEYVAAFDHDLGEVRFIAH